jgi:hypothetical protein
MPLLKRFRKINVLTQIQNLFLMPSQHLIRKVLLFLVVLFSFQSSIFAAKDAFSSLLKSERMRKQFAPYRYANSAYRA